MSNSTTQFSVEVQGGARLSERQRITHANLVSPGWFATYGTRLVAGRDFTPHDTAGAPRVAIVNEAFARRFLNGASPLGRTVRPTFGPPGRINAPMEIVGVVADAVYRTLRDSVPPTLYVPIMQVDEPSPVVRLSIRSAGPSPAMLVRDVTSAVARVDPHLALTFRPLKDFVDASLMQERMVAMLSGFFGGLALLLATLGLYGVTSHAVNRRRSEIGIRIALGATPAAVVRNVLTRAGARQDIADDRRGRRPEGDADADLAATPVDCVRCHAVQAEGCEQKRQAAEETRQHRDHALLHQ